MTRMTLCAGALERLGWQRGEQPTEERLCPLARQWPDASDACAGQHGETEGGDTRRILGVTARPIS